MKKLASTKENINTLIEIRQAVYAHVFQKRRDALFDTLHALLAGGTFASFVWLSQSERFQRKWPSLYAAVEDGQIDPEALRRLLLGQLSQKGICVFPLNSSSWARPRSCVLEDLQYVYQASSMGTKNQRQKPGLLSFVPSKTGEPHCSTSTTIQQRDRLGRLPPLLPLLDDAPPYPQKQQRDTCCQ